MNKIAIRVPTTRFIVSVQARPSKIREKRNQVRDELWLNPVATPPSNSLADDEQP